VTRRGFGEFFVRLGVVGVVDVVVLPFDFTVVVSFSLSVETRIISFNSLVRMESVVPIAVRPLSLHITCISLYFRSCTDAESSASLPFDTVVIVTIEEWVCCRRGSKRGLSLNCSSVENAEL